MRQEIAKYLQSILLIKACATDDEFGLARALSCGAEVDAKDNLGWTAAMAASFNGSEDCLRALVDAGADLNEKHEYTGFTAMMWAARKGQDGCLRILIAAGANLDIQENLGRTAVMVAVAEQMESCFLTLIKAGADLDTKDRCGDTVTALAEKSGNEHMAALAKDSALAQREKALFSAVSTEPANGKRVAQRL